MDKNIKALKKMLGKNEDFVFLCSSASAPYSEGESILAYDKVEEVSGNNFELLENKLSNNRDKFDNSWFGYLSYDLKNRLESLRADKDFFISYPKIQFSKFKSVSNFRSESALEGFGDLSIPKVKYLKSNMTKQDYLEKVIKIKRLIRKGDLCQANLTRKFYGEFEGDIKHFDIFLKLSRNSPAPYSAFMKFDDLYIVSSSPELFLKVDSKGRAVTCPIKGSSGKGEEKELSKSVKDRAENLMITDLMRNDFSRSCKTGSVKVEGLFKTSSFKTINHMHSTVKGALKSGDTAFSLTKNCFPPGSMTGTPKIMAMEVCSELEDCKRGIYSGALGYFGGDGSVDLSVVIRTIIIKGDKFEFQVGGAIIYDSDPEKEWQETMIKASAIAKTLGVTKDIKEL